MSKPLWTADEIAAATAGQTNGAFEVGGISIDSRSLQQGDLFVALTDMRDGHDFAAMAFEAGAAGALVSRPVEGGPYVLVDDVLEALKALGLAARDRAKDCYRVAVTGSVGKTSVKEMIAEIFRAEGRAHWSVKSFNNHWGVPLSLARMPRDTEYAVFEIGMSTPGEIAPRSVMVAPHVALITKIAAAHLEGVGTLEGVAREKSDIFAGLLPGGNIILPQDSAFFEDLRRMAFAHQKQAELLTFGRLTTSSVRVLSTERLADGSRIAVSGFDDVLAVNLPAIGDHWADNAAAAILAACAGSNIDPTRAASALANYQLPAGRGTVESLDLPSHGRFTLVDDAYNANPESMRAALSAFAMRATGGRRIVALGEMLEIGATSEDEHVGLAEPILAIAPDLVFLSGAGMEPLAEVLKERTETIWAGHAEALDNPIKEQLKDGDHLLLKGSNASGRSKLAARLRAWRSDAQTGDKKGGAESAVMGDNAV